MREALDPTRSRSAVARAAAQGAVTLLWALPLGAITAAVVTLAGPEGGILLVLALVATVVAVRMPGTVLAALVLVPFYKAAIQPYIPVDITAVLAALNALQVIPVLRDHRPRSWSNAGLVLWGAFGVLVLAGVLYAPDQQLALGAAAGFWGLVIVPITPAALRCASEPRHIRQFLWTVFIVGVVVIILGMAQLLDGASTGGAPLVVLGSNTIAVGRAALLVPLLGLPFVLRSRTAIARVSMAILTPAAFIVAIATGSRGPLLVLLALGGLGLLDYVARPHRTDWRLATVLGGAALATLFVTIGPGLLPVQSVERFAIFAGFVEGAVSATPVTLPADTSSEARLGLFGVALTMFEERPILGWGVSAFATMSPAVLGTPAGDTYPHNAVLQVAAESGLVGLFLVIGLVSLALTRRLPRGPAGIVRLLFLFFFLNAMVSGDILEDRMTWALLMLLLVADAAPASEEDPALVPVLTPTRSPSSRHSSRWIRA